LENILSSSVGLLNPDNIGFAWKSHAYLVYKLIYKYFQSNSRLLGVSTSGFSRLVPLPVTSDSFTDSSIRMAVVENGG